MFSGIKQRFRALSIRWRGLIFLVAPMLIISAALTILGYHSSLASHRQAARDKLDEVIASNLRSAERIVVFGESAAARGFSERLQAFPAIEMLVLYDARGTGVFAYRTRAYAERSVPPLAPEQWSFKGAQLTMIRPLRSDAGTFGFVRIDAYIHEIERASIEGIKSASRVFVGTLLVVALMAGFLHLLIIRPIIRLSEFVRQVSREGDYDARLQLADDAEMGALRDGVHELLERIRGEHERVIALNGSLQVAKERAELASTAKSRFLARVSHELRTPLNGVIGIIELLSRGELQGDERREYLDSAQVSSLHLMRIINDTLDLSQIEHGNLKLRSEPFSLSEQIDALERAMAPTMRAAELRFSCALADDVPDTLVGDSARLMQILFNLVGNARKFTEPGGEVAVAVSPRERSAQSIVLHFEVRDTGAGIAPDQCERIFEAYQQAEGAGTNIAEGSGLGLAISSRLVELMDGNIGVNSVLGQGSTFWFDIRLDLDGRDSAAARASLSEIAIETPTIAPMSVLLVDDNRVNRAVAARMLAIDGHRVETCENGAQALERIASGSFDLVLMDVHMPVMDGLTATRAVREVESTSGQHLPIVALTASALASEVERILASGLDSCLSKPITLAALRAAVAEVAARK